MRLHRSLLRGKARRTCQSSGMDERMRALEAGQAEISGQFTIMHDYILRRNLREPEGAPEAVPGD